MTFAFSRLWQEPLLHFLLIGAALFLYYDVVGEGDSEALVPKFDITSYTVP